MKRYAMLVGLVVSCAAFSLVTGCRAFNSAYSNPEADVAAKPRKVDPSENKKPPEEKKPSESEGAPLPQVDYSKDTTVCDTPKEVTVGKNDDALMAASGWTQDGSYDVVVTATQRGPNSADITIAKTQAACPAGGTCPDIFLKPITLSFTVKQTAADKFSACNFKYTEGKDRVYQGVTGSLMVDRVNAVVEKDKLKTVTNSGTFHLTFTRAAEVIKAQAVLLGSAASGDLAGILLEGTYFTNNLVEASPQ